MTICTGVTSSLTNVKKMQRGRVCVCFKWTYYLKRFIVKSDYSAFLPEVPLLPEPASQGLQVTRSYRKVFWNLMPRM